MLVSYRWLKEYVDVDAGPEEVAEALTMAGVAVEGVKRSGMGASVGAGVAAAGGVGTGGLRVARLSGARRHPASDHLWLCDVDAGEGFSRQVVCGAPNVRAGDMVALALPGATLPGGRRIEETVLRGQASSGMLVSARELGLFEDRPEMEAGILVLPADAPLGADAVPYLGLDDAILAMDLTPNRGDCLSVVGVAREVAALFALPLRLPATLGGGEAAAAGGAGDAGSAAPWPERVVPVAIEAPTLCPRYSALVLDGVRIGPSPGWLQERVRAAGMRPINNVVDVTNYVMLEVGQPLHAFDYAQLAGGRIVVREARPGERIVTLDGSERELAAGTLLICDGRRPVAVAGVMGGLDSEVTDKTTVILLESAHFLFSSVRRTARRLGLPSEASSRFEKGVDPMGTMAALARAHEFLLKVGAARGATAWADEWPGRVEPLRIALRPARVNAVLSLDLEAAAMAGYLRRLGFETSAPRAGEGAGGSDDGGQDGGVGGAIEVTVPTRRPDITHEIDLIEEIGRLHGFAGIPATLPQGALTAGRRSDRADLASRARATLAAAGLDEVVTYAFSDPATWDRWGLPPDHPWRRMLLLRNPLSSDRAALRTSLLPGLLDALAFNMARQVAGGAAFEVAKVYRPKDLPPRGLVPEPVLVAAAAAGEVSPKTWHTPAVRADYYFMKGVVQGLLEQLGCQKPRFEAAVGAAAGVAGLHPGRAARVSFDGTAAGFVGELLPALAAAYRLPEGTCVMELELDALAENMAPAAQYVAPPRYPAVVRDLAFVVDAAVPAERVEAVIRGAGGALLEEVRLFDVYQGPSIPDGCRSLAYTLAYRLAERTLTDPEVDAAHDEVRRALVTGLGATLRS